MLLLKLNLIKKRLFIILLKLQRMEIIILVSIKEIKGFKEILSIVMLNCLFVREKKTIHIHMLLVN